MIRQIKWFAIVGVIGFVVDTAMLYGLMWLGLGHSVSRLGSFLCAAFVTWLINRRVTFRGSRGGGLLKEWASYMLAMSGGGLLNLAAYEVVMSSIAYRPILPAVAVGVGSLTGMVFNFLAAKFWVFRHPH